MLLNDALSKAAKPRARATESVYEMVGTLEPDFDDAYFRLYPDPNVPLHYFAIRKEDVTDEVHELTTEEAVHAGFIGKVLHKLRVRHGTSVLHYTVAIEKVGETFDPSLGKEVEGKSGCRHSTGCSSGCCTNRGGRCRCDNCCIA